MKYNSDNLISWEDFSKIEMRVGTVLSATVFEKAKLPAYIMTIDFGDFGQLKTSAQITKRYKTEELIGKQIIAVINFPPKQIATIMSECLVLGVLGSHGDVTLLAPDQKVENGQRIG